jgi:ADP-ribosylation factor-like protein 8
MSWYFNSFVSWLKSKLWSREIEISIVGLQNAGKSTLMGTLATGGFNEDTIPTIGFNYKRMKKGKVGMNVWDLGGQQRFRESWEKYCRQSDIIVYVVDGVDLSCMEEARK